jgi:hypothetical protein
VKGRKEIGRQIKKAGPLLPDARYRTGHSKGTVVS